MREALRDWIFRRSQREQAIDELRRQWDGGIANDDAQVGETAFKRFSARLRAHSATMS